MADRRAVRAGSGRRSPLLVFIHVPKTAGTTVRNILVMNEPGERTRALNNVFKGGGGFDSGLIERLRSGKGPLDRSPTDLATAKILRGHCPLGIRDYLGEHVQEGREVHYFTFLRNPVDRILSHYFLIREERRGYGSGKHALAPLPADPTLENMRECGYIHDNLQTRMLSGLPEPFGEVTDGMLKQAKGNLRDGLIFFGLTERFAESVVLAKQRLGLRSILYKTEGRRNSARPRGQDVPEELREAAERCNRYDIELYRYAQELFDSIPERPSSSSRSSSLPYAPRRAKARSRSRRRPPRVSPGMRGSGECCCMRARWCCAWSGRSAVAGPVS